MKFKLQIISLILLLVSFIVISCRNDTDNKSGNEASIKVRISEISFFESENIDNYASAKVANLSQRNLIQQKSIPLNNGLTLEAKLIPLARNETQAYVNKNALPGIRYKVVVYDNTGNYVTERDYINGQESETKELRLAANRKYTFITYSINSPKELPSVSFSDPAVKNLNTSVVSGIKGDSELLYSRREMTVSANGSNELNVILQYKFSQITSILIKSEDKISTINNVTISSHYPNAEINLTDGRVKRTGNIENLPVEFTGLNNTEISSKPVVFNGSGDNIAVNISSITFESNTLTNISIPLQLIPGSKYTLQLNVYNDQYIIYKGQSAARIGGKIWMRHNLGADTSLDPDQNPMVKELHGNYYQWGYPDVVGTPSSTVMDKSFPKPEDDKRWNSGSVLAPVKTQNDPCPNGFRVPSTIEFTQLINNTKKVGEWFAQSDTEYKGSVKFVSKSNPNILLTFPSGGRLSSSYLPGGIFRNSDGFYGLNSDGSVNITNYTTQFNNYSGFAHSIRCIAE
ncbi:TPA: hypothetical protein ACGZ92_002589 [Elizabethkingia anophelis]